MIRIARALGSARVVVLALGALALTAPLASAKQAYPPGWNNTGEQMAPTTYQFVPGGKRYHQVGGTILKTSSLPTDIAAYQFVPGGSRPGHAT